jgi:predicted GH43/DUF377 family glycosyl hydrolase
VSAIPVTRTHTYLRPDPRRVILKPFVPGGLAPRSADARVRRVVDGVKAMRDADVAASLDEIRATFDHRHRALDNALERNCASLSDRGLVPGDVDAARCRLIGAYFSHEYAIEAAALSNPSMVPAPDQSGMAKGEQRFVVSFRAIGEGHLSSIEFRTGSIDADARITIDEPSPYASTGERHEHRYDSEAFRAKLSDLGALNEIAAVVLDPLGPRFTFERLETSMARFDRSGVDRAVAFETMRIIHWIAASNYSVTFSDRAPISERVLFPSGPSESQGMEDARMVRFSHDDGSVSYYATYTAFDGFQILPQLIETKDFVSFDVVTLNGPAAQNKGMALFPRMLDGRYAALSRQDNENNFIMFSDNIRFWHERHKLQEPARPWELLQLGNCGSPIETDAGWLVITHGVGPMRRYALGAILLDLVDPRRVIGHLKEPLLAPSPDERDGYVPNVVYSCGSMLHGDRLLIPYGISDVESSFVTVQLEELLSRLTRS